MVAGFAMGESTVKSIRKWIRAKPGNTIYFAFYLFAIPISLSIGMQAAAVAGVISTYMSMAISFGMLIGLSHTMNLRADGLDGNMLSTKKSGPMVKVIAWSHFRRTIVWVDDFEVSIEELLVKLAVNMGVSVEDVQIEGGAGDFVDETKYHYPLWKLRKNDAVSVSTSFFGFMELSIFVTVFDEHSNPELKKHRLEANKKAKEVAFKAKEAMRKRALKANSPRKKKRVFTTKWIKKRFGSKKNGEEIENCSDEESNVDEEEDMDAQMDRIVEERRKRLEALDENHTSLSTKEKKKIQYLKSFDIRKKVTETEGFLPKQNTVDQFVNMIMADESMNISAIPDNLENTIYELVLSKSLGTLYKLMHKGFTTVSIFGHHLELDIEEGMKDYIVNKPPIDVEAVEALVDVLLEYKAVNITLLADSVEKQIYTNVLVVGFGVIQTFLDSFMIDFCGHRLEAKFKPNGIGFIKKEERMDDFKDFLSSSVDDSMLNAFIDDMMNESGADDNWVPDVLEKAIFRSIFCLVLYVFKEISGEVVINLLGDNFRMRLVPGAPEVSEKDLQHLEEETRKEFLAEATMNVDEHKLILAVGSGLVAGGLFF